MTPPTTAERQAARYAVPLVALLLFAVEASLTFPGELIDDSIEQLRQATTHQFGDWHPPMMALLWSWLIRLTGTRGSLLVFQQALHWMGFGVMADACHRTGRPRMGWVVLAAGAFPLFLFYDRVLVKDVEMASAYVAAVGLGLWFLQVRRSIPAWAIAIAAVLLLYGTLTRTNAVFALGPLLCLFLLGPRGRRWGGSTVVAVSAVVALIALPVSGLVNHRLIEARPQDSLQSLQIYDLVGMAVRSGDPAVLGPSAPPFDAVRACYTAYWWDPFSEWGSCAALRRGLPYAGTMQERAPAEQRAERGELWRRAIETHPVDYALHRLSHFNSSIYFIVPSLHFRFAKSASVAGRGPAPFSAREIRIDYLKKNFLFWPVFWLAAGVGSLLLLPAGQGASSPSRPAASSADNAMSRAPPLAPYTRLLILSGLLYSGAYLLIGVATDVRYYYWPTMAILLGIILGWPDLVSGARARHGRAAVAALLLLIVLAGGYAARLADVPFV